MVHEVFVRLGVAAAAGAAAAGSLLALLLSAAVLLEDVELLALVVLGLFNCSSHEPRGLFSGGFWILLA